MTRARLLKPGFFLNEELAELPPLARLLFAGLWCIADREGRLEDRPKRIKHETLPYDDVDVDELLTQLHEADFIHRYVVDGARYIQIVHFIKHQSPHVREPQSVLPAPMPAPDKHGAGTVLVLDKHQPGPAVAVAVVVAESVTEAEAESVVVADAVEAPGTDVADSVSVERRRHATTNSSSSSSPTLDVVTLCERIAKRTNLPQRPDMLEQLSVVIESHLARGLSPGDIWRDVLNLTDPSREKHVKRPSVSQISNWLTHTHPAENLAALAAVSASNGHRLSRGDAAANGHYIRRRREPDLPDPTQNGKYAHRFTVVGDDDASDPGDPGDA